MRLALLFVLVVAACSGKSKPATNTAGSGESEGSGSGSGTFLAQKIIVSFGFEAEGASNNVFLQTTDETGKQVSHPVGTYPGQCTKTSPAPEMKAIVAVLCKDGATGVELHAVVQDADIIVLKMRVDDGVAPDPMAREEVTRVKTPMGASITPE
jgi:hypothetical protein